MTAITSAKARHPRSPVHHRLPLTLFLAAVAATSGSCDALALPSCEGTYAATSLQPLPQHVVLGLDIHDRSPANLKLAERFLAGIRSAGVTVGSDPNVLLHVTASVLGGAGAATSKAREEYYPDLRGLGGGRYQALPPMPSSSLTNQSQRSAAGTLFLRVDATAGQEPRVAWVASLQCRMVGTDDGARAEAIGKVVGATLGSRVDRHPL
jgi:hypothetical protein